MAINLDTPLSLYSIALTYILAYYPHNVKYRLISGTIGFDNLNPRDTESETLLKRGMKPELVAKVQRLTGAHRNGNEVFSLWAIAVLAANQVGVEQFTLNVASVAFIVSRLLFNYIYINQKSEVVAAFRSLVFVISIGIPIYLITISGNRLRTLT